MISAAWSAAVASPSNTATAVSLSLPSTVKGGDVMLLRVAWNNGGTTPLVTCTNPTGWTLLDTATSGACSLSTYWKLAAGTVGGTSTDASSTVSATLSSAKAFAVTCDGYAGVDQAAPINAHAMQVESTSGTSHATPTVSVTAAGAWLVSVIAERVSTTSFTVPTGFTARAFATNVGAAGSPVTLDAADAVAGTTGSLTAGTWTGGATATTQVVTASVALKPAATGTGTPALVKQTVSSNATGVANQAISFTNTAGNLLVLLYARSGGLATGAITSITDASGNTWQVGTRGAVSGGTNTRLEAWYCANAVATTGITVNSATSQSNSWSVLEFSGVATTTPLDVASADNSATTSSTTVATPSITTGNASDLLIAAAHFPQTTTTGPSGWTGLTDFDYSTTGSGRAAYRVVSATGGYSASWTLAAAAAAGVLTIGFKAGAGTAKTKVLSGQVPSSSRMLRGVAKVAAGASTPAGSKTARSSRKVTGQLTPAGTKLTAYVRVVTGAVSFAGSLLLGHPKILTSSLFSNGAIARAVAKKPAGSSTPTGSHTKRSTYHVTANLTSTAGAKKQVTVFRGGSTQPLASVGRIATRFRTFTGTLTSTAGVTRLWSKKPTGTVTPSNTPKPRSFKKRPSGQSRPTGSLVSTAIKRLFGRAGKAQVDAGPAVDIDVSFYLRHRAQITVFVVADADIAGE